MRITMTGLATRKLFQHGFAVGLAMTTLTFRDVAMSLCMAIHAGEAGMFSRTCSQRRPHSFVTGLTDGIGDILSITDLRRGVNRVTSQATCIPVISRVGFCMAFRTSRQRAMAGMMTLRAGQQGVFTFELRKFLDLSGMAGIAVRRQFVQVGQTGNRGMGIQMAFQAFFKPLAVEIAMAPFALRDSVLPGYAGLHRMKGLMTFLTMQLMFSASVTNRIENADMAPGTF